ncbi:MAG: hypothetical protein OZ948_10325 [Deltaproteobacteria bacterium]|nr:hypothetical protein [Deltaproteobacteria bacterium]
MAKQPDDPERRDRDPAAELLASRQPEIEAETRSALRRVVLVIVTATLVGLVLYLAYQG